MSSFINYGENYENHPALKQIKDLRSKYNLVIYHHDFANENEEKILEASGINSDTIIEILKLYQLTPVFHIVITQIMEVI